MNPMASILRYIFHYVIIVFVSSCVESNIGDNTNSTHKHGMVWIPDGEFIMGTNDINAYEHERPAHTVRVNGFWIDTTEVTNDAFRIFVDSTEYITVAERNPDWEELATQLPRGTPKPPDSLLVSGSLVFVAPQSAVLLNDVSKWWFWTPGASWSKPNGPESSLVGKGDHPVVHIAYEDALAYCAWLQKRLPTEAEWEFAALGNLQNRENLLTPGHSLNGAFISNTFQGSFPAIDTGEDGFIGVSPVGSFPSNKFGLYDMIGNVWEWTSDWYDEKYFKSLALESELAINPQGPKQPYDSSDPYSLKRVTKGGSFLCSEKYCANYRTSARQGSEVSSGSSNIGFRCVKD